MTDPVVWPLEIRPHRQSFWLAMRTQRFDNPYDETAQLIEWQGSRWQAELVLRRAGPAALLIQALVDRIAASGLALVPDFRRLSARGSLAGTPQVTGGSGGSLSVTGFTPGATVLLPGDLVQASPGRAHMVTAPVVAVAGTTPVPIAPPLRGAVEPGPLVTSAARVRMALVEDAIPNPATATGRTEWTLAFVEDLSAEGLSSGGGS